MKPKGPERLSVELPDEEWTTALCYRASAGESEVVLVLGHGAGASQTSDFMVSFAGGLASRGINVVTFNFSYMERGRKLPDRTEKLELCYRSLIRRVREHRSFADKKLFIGGKSLGGRIASQVAAAQSYPEVTAAGLVFLGYPLHPPGKPEKLRSSHLLKIRLPMLFCQGSRDAFGTPQELRPILTQLPATAELCVIEGGDHSFRVPRRSGVPQEEIYRAIQDRITAWVQKKKCRKKKGTE